MVKKLDVVVAETHSSEYLLHKYWARKPHNVISYFLSELVPEDGLIIDPFCGSGVVLHEAQKLGINSIGFDINPIATLITSVLINPPQSNEFISTVSSILNSVETEIYPYYSTDSGQKIKYIIHNVVAKCPKCQNTVSSFQAIKKGKKSLCPFCNTELKFNLENYHDSIVSSVCIEGQKEQIIDNNLLIKQKEYSNTSLFCDNVNDFNYAFATNRRILSFKGMETKSLFTCRNFSILCHIANKFNQVKEKNIRDAALLLLTASVAQCSRLIPTRNNLSTGGPAWSVPGFWVPAQHLETNPISHLKARLKKFSKGLQELNTVHKNAYTEVSKTDAIIGMKNLIEEKKKVDLAFLDPPYGDNVPYIEFSSIWNSFLKDFPDPAGDFSVSDRQSREVAWKNYKYNMSNTLYYLKRVLKPEGHLLLTFNNNDIKAWESLLSALQENGFICNYVTYQIPAVISSKAQFSPNGSYLSDLYGIFSINDNIKTTTSLSSIVNKLIQCATSRDGKIAKNLANRVIMIEWIKNDIDSSLLSEIEDITKTLFTEKEGFYIYKGSIPKNSFSLKEQVNLLAKEILEKGPCEWNYLYKTISAEFEEYGFLDSTELLLYLENRILFKNQKCISYI